MPESGSEDFLERTSSTHSPDQEAQGRSKRAKKNAKQKIIALDRQQAGRPHKLFVAKAQTERELWPKVGDGLKG
jgi:hypothetical protein